MGWSKTFLEWVEGPTAYLSVAFTWHLPAAYSRAVWLREMGYAVRAGGPAVALMPDYLRGVAECGGEMPGAIQRHNPQATRTSTGCVRECSFCAAWRTEGSLKELDDWPPGRLVCDNNLLACSRKHVDLVIDRQKRVPGMTDFNQGLDCRLLRPWMADRLAELNCLVRLSFDSVSYESRFVRAFEVLRKAGFPKKRVRVYVLIGYDDTPDDALYRLQTVASLGIDPNPMRYNPLDALVRDGYVAPGWTDSELTRFMRYWANLRYLRAVPFVDFV